MTITKENFTVQPTYELYSQAIKTGVELCFDDKGNYLPFVEEIAVYYPILLYFTDCDPQELTLESCFNLIFDGKRNTVLDAIMETENAYVYESVAASIRNGIEAQKKATTSAFEMVGNALINQIGGVDVASDLLLALLDGAVAAETEMQTYSVLES